jgi:outer membrane receptor for ferrienterochelin and colicins
MNVLATPNRAIGAVLAAAVALAPAAPLAAEPAARPAVAEKSLADLLAMEIPEVYSASKRAQKASEAPASVTVVTAEEIHRFGWRTLGDVLKGVRGFYVSNDRNYYYVGARGFARPGDYNSRVLLLIDGHRVNENVYDSAFMGTDFPVDIDLVDRIEVVRGPSSSLYGTSAIFGIVNVVTRRPAAGREFEAFGEGGSLGTGAGRAAFRGTVHGIGVVAAASAYHSRGQERLYFPEYDAPETNGGLALDADRDRTRRAFFQLSYRDLTLQTVYGSRDKQVPTGSFGTIFNDPRLETTDTRAYTDLRFEPRLGDKGSLLARAYYDAYDYDGTYPYEYGDAEAPAPGLNYDGAAGRWWGAEVKVTRPLFGGQTVTAGAELRDNLRQHQLNYDQERAFTNVDDTRRSTVWAAYAQDEVSVGRHVTVHAGVRHDHYDTFGGTTNPRLAVLVRPAGRSTVKLLYGRAFRAPNVYENFTEGTGFSGNPDLDPERVETFEVVLEQGLGERTRLSVAGFDYTASRLINQVEEEDGRVSFRNLGKVDARGVEAEVEHRFAGGARARAAFTVQDVKDRENAERLTNSPRTTGLFQLMAPLAGRRAVAGLDATWLGRRRTLGGGEVSPALLANLTLSSGESLGKVDVALSVYNVLDRRYADPGAEEHLQQALPQDGRQVRARVRLRF